MEFFHRIIFVGTVAALFGLAPPGWAHEKMQHKHGQENTVTSTAPVTMARTASSKSEIAMFFSHLKKPEYIHVLINPIPIFGMGLGLLLLLIARFRPAEGLLEAGLAVIIFTGLATYPTIKLGQKAYDRIYETIPLEGQMWLDVHMDRAEKFQYLFYLAAVLAAASLWTRKIRPKAHRRLLLATMATSGLCASLAGLIAHAGGQVHHSEFREGPPPAGSVRKAPPDPAPDSKEQP
ncbi:MAG: hypothetical protein HY549_03125 [Elusimicrobia bacterium]|nr:hypothetical protein [Elusimicrobiota bacterium]